MDSTDALIRSRCYEQRFNDDVDDDDSDGDNGDDGGGGVEKWCRLTGSVRYVVKATEAAVDVDADLTCSAGVRVSGALINVWNYHIKC